MWFRFELNWLVKKSWTIKLLYKVTLYYYFSWGIKFLIFWTSYSYKQFVLFPHMVSQEQVLKPNVGLSEHSNSELFCANNTISSDLETFYIKTFLVTFLCWSSSLRKSWLTKNLLVCQDNKFLASDIHRATNKGQRLGTWDDEVLHPTLHPLPLLYPQRSFR